MSDFSCPIVKLSGIAKHPNADALSIVTVEGCPVIIRTEDWSEGQRAIYVPVEAVVPETVPGTEFLGEHRRIKAKRLRGIFSMGLLLPVKGTLTTQEPGGTGPKGYQVGEDVAELLGIKKYEEPERAVAGNKNPSKNKVQIKDPKLGPVYDLESYRKYGNKVFADGEPVIVTEKIHGTNFRFGHKTDRSWKARFKSFFTRKAYTKFCVGSHRTWRGKDDNSYYWQISNAHDLNAKTAKYADYCFYGEIYGDGVQDLTYGCGQGELKVALFDVFDSQNKVWLDHDSIKNLAKAIDIPLVPVVYDGPLDRPVVEAMCNGKSTLAPKQIREGVVIRKKYDTVSQYSRPVLKLVGEDYLLRKNGTEGH